MPGPLTPELASAVVAFDALTLNVDRTAKNPNLLTWHRKLWLIDHGASLYFHHGWANPEEAARSTFPPIRQHVLLRFASALSEVRFEITHAQLEAIVANVPDAWLENEPGFSSAAAVKTAYVQFLETRIANRARFVEEATRARVQPV